MSVEPHLTHIEMWFAVGALAITIVVGLVLYPAVREALREGQEGEDSGQKG